MRTIFIAVAIHGALLGVANAQSALWQQPPAPVTRFEMARSDSSGDGLAQASYLVALASANDSYPPAYGSARDHGPSWTLPDACCREPESILSIYYGYDSWRGVPDGSWTNNGLHTGLNLGTNLGQFSDWTGFGFQIGGTVGVYNLAGTDYRVHNQDRPTVQGMVTLGLFRRASCDSPLTAAIVQDWMINQTYSVMGEDSVMYQWRGQLGYALSDATEIGLWGVMRGAGDTRNVGGFGDVHWRPINQLSFFWHKKWSPGGADTWISIGMPETQRLNAPGSLGDYVVGAWVVAPLNDRFSIYSSVNYMHQSAGAGDPGAKEEAWNFFMGVSFTVGHLARSDSVKGHRWAPLLPVANNGTFLVDASQNF